MKIKDNTLSGLVDNFLSSGEKETNELGIKYCKANLKEIIKDKTHYNDWLQIINKTQIHKKYPIPADLLVNFGFMSDINKKTLTILLKEIYKISGDNTMYFEVISEDNYTSLDNCIKEIDSDNQVKIESIVEKFIDIFEWENTIYLEIQFGDGICILSGEESITNFTLTEDIYEI